MKGLIINTENDILPEYFLFKTVSIIVAPFDIYDYGFKSHLEDYDDGIYWGINKENFVPLNDCKLIDLIFSEEECIK